MSATTSPPSSKVMVTATQIQSGPYLDPLKRLLVYTDDEWESFIDEWVSHALKAKYKQVIPFAGANDMGIDIAGYADDKMLAGVWDNYQCKHLGHPIMPSEAYVEIGKILWYSFEGHYLPPREYFFVAPRGTGTTLTRLLGNSAKLKESVLKAWDKSCRREITNTQEVVMDGDFAAYVAKFDFSIFKTIPVRTIIEQHRSSSYFVKRFGGGLPERPVPEIPPDDISDGESVYVAKLLAAYGNHNNEPISDIAGLKKWSKLEKHFQRQREAFYHAESLRVFVRDKVEQGTFENLQAEIYNGIIDTRDANHPDDYQRVVAVTERAVLLPLQAHPLAASTFAADKHGICHQLANDGRLEWTE